MACIMMITHLFLIAGGGNMFARQFEDQTLIWTPSEAVSEISWPILLGKWLQKYWYSDR